ncbi:YpmS family protein [Weissella diestrammenae]|nr:YpmS family protein [Weissella diestrammenae]
MRHQFTKEQKQIRNQGLLWGIGGTLIAVVLLSIVLLLLPQNQAGTKDVKPNIADAAMEVRMTKTNLNAWLNQYLNNDPDLKGKFRFEMAEKSMMVYGTERLLGQHVDYGMKMTPSVTKNGNLLLHADSVAVGQLPLPVKYVMSALGDHLDLPKWVTVNAHDQTIRINLNQIPNQSGLKFKIEKINMEKNQFIFRAGLSN